MTSLNWGDLIKQAGEVASYEALPDGTYDMMIIEASATTSQSGKSMFKVTAEVQGGPFNKRRVWDNLVVTQDNSTALGIFFSKMKALGLNQEFFATQPTNARIEQAMMGRKFRAKIGSRVWQGNKKNEIKSYFPMEGAAAAPTTAAAPGSVAAPPPAPAPAPAPAAPPPSPAPTGVPVAEEVTVPPAPF